MKIFDLLSEDQQHQTTGGTRQYSGTFKQSKAAFNDAKSGAFSSVKPDKNDPHMVKKYHHGPMEDDHPDAQVGEDAFVYFALWLANQKVTNPCLPRIYDIKKIKDKTGKFIYRYQVEKLQAGLDLDMSELWHVYDQYFDSNETGQENLLDFGLTHGNPDSNKKDFMLAIGRACEEYVKGEPSNIKSTELQRALDLVAEFLKSHRNKMFSLDIENSGNIMFRRGPHGLQLVITDPVA